MSERITEIVGRDGVAYQCAIFSNEEDFHIRLFRSGRRVGYLKAKRIEQAMRLDDIKIERVLDFMPRYQGLGSTMLNLLLEHARGLNCEAVTANAFPEDLTETPGLLRWCEKRGFQVTQKGAGYLLHRAVS